MTEPLRGGAGRKPKFHVGQVVRVIVDITKTNLKNGNESRALEGEFLAIIETEPLKGKTWTGIVSLLPHEVRPLTQREKGKP